MQVEKVDDEVEKIDLANATDTSVSVLHDVLLFVPEISSKMMPNTIAAEELPTIEIKKGSLNATSMKLLCIGIEAELFGKVYSSASLSALKHCTVALSPTGQGACLKALSLPSTAKLYFAGSVSHVPSAGNCLPLCVT